MDPNRWTLKTQEAFNAAMSHAAQLNNPEVTPDHLLAALLGQADGVVLPILEKVGASPAALRNRTEEAIAKLPKAYGSEARLSRDLSSVVDQADAERAELTDEYLSTEHLLIALTDRLGVSKEDLLTALRDVRGSHRVTSQNPEDQYQALEKYGRDLTEAAPRSHARTMVLAGLVGVVVALGLGTLYPLSAQNAWARLAMPWKETPRYTFAAVQPLPSQVVVAHGEPFTIALELLPSTEWKPEEATLAIGGQAPLVAQRGEGNSYEFAAPAQIDELPLKIQVGDWQQSVALQPMLRPELTQLGSTVTLPAYLERTEPLTLDIRGGSATLVKGSQADITAVCARPHGDASLLEQAELSVDQAAAGQDGL